METIPKSDCQRIGFIRKVHGVKGELVLEFEPEFEESIATANRFLLEIDGLLVPFFVAEGGLRFKSDNSALVTFDWVENVKYAQRLVNSPAFLYLQEIIQRSDELSFARFLNFRLLNENTKEIGIITSIANYSGNIVLTVNAKGREMLVPFNKDILLNLDENKKTIQLQLPEGLMK
jgi:16S rRNA processing protein RimM